MANNMLKIPATLPSGEIVAIDVSAEDFLTLYADTRHEWVDGVVIRMSPNSRTHIRLIMYLQQLLNAYFALQPIGEILIESFAMRLEHSFREPDVMVILNDNTAEYTETRLNGAADICIEIVSDESIARDYGDKLAEYEQAGVKEYWIIDPNRQTAYFHRLQPNQRYTPIAPIDDVYETHLLPKFRLNVEILWHDHLPNYYEIGEMVRAMLEEL